MQLTSDGNQKYTQQSVFNIYNQKMKYKDNGSIVKDFSTGNLNLEELVDREDEFLSYTDPRIQTKKAK